jgi:formylglycine-generating enzyme required for sulfatase activity
MPLGVDQVLNDRYRIVALLGQGGFGAVYQAWDLSFDRPRALKENLDTNPEAQRQFAREARLLNGLRHSNFPLVLDYFVIPGQGQYLVMDFIEGEDLETMLHEAHGPLPEAQVLPWIRQVCAALTYLHEQSPPVIHRDVKPANIRISPKGQAVLVDFGIAKVYDTESRTTMGARAVTQGYSPPEQYGQATTDARTDVYALGATLYALVTGQRPPDAIARVAGASLRLPRALNPAVSPATEQAILRALEITPAQRWRSIAEFAAALPSAESAQPVAPPVLAELPEAPPTLIVPAPQALAPEPVPEAAGIPPRPAAVFAGLPGAEPASGTPSGFAEAPVPSAPAEVAEAQGAPVAARQTRAARRLAGPRTYLVTGGLVCLLVLVVGVLTPPGQALLGDIAARLRIGTTGPTVRTSVAEIDGMVQVYVPAGEFMMGSAAGDPRARDGERPQHRVTLAAFWIDRTEVTDAQFARFVQATGHKTDAEQAGWGFVWIASGWEVADGADWKHPRGPDAVLSDWEQLPVVQVSWNDAAAYCQWAGRRLPSEAEWEKAARWTDERVYPWGNAFDGRLLNFCDQACPLNGRAAGVADGHDLLAPVGQYTAGASPYGALDLAGNVAEWIADRYAEDYYARSPAADPPGPNYGNARVVRGGSWSSTKDYVRAAARLALRSDVRA